MFGGSNINFWFPQKRSSENGHFKQTLSGRLTEIHEANEDILPDHDVNIIVVPSSKYNYLIDEAKGPELTKITSIGLRVSGEVVECPQKFFQLEAEIDARESAKGKLLALNRGRINQNICIYGSWIFDAGHCDQPEIHPAEQIWWSSLDIGNNRTYNCNVFCDASKRYWWRHQMDNGTKIKPWGAPPITSVFALAFEITPGRPAKTFEVTNIDDYNVAVFPNSNKSYNLVYQNNTIVSFKPHNDAFKVSYENVGITPANKIRGFLVIETTVGTVTQVKTSIAVQATPNAPLVTISIPMGADPNKIDQTYEELFFKKEEGHYMFTVLRSNYK